MSGNERSVSGIVERSGRGAGVLRDPANLLQPTPEDVKISQQLMRQSGLVDGIAITGTAALTKRGAELRSIESYSGLDADAFNARVRFERMTAIDPTERFNLGVNGNVSMRVMDLITPIGKGTRGLIVAPPKAGKTQLLEEIADGLSVCAPDTRVIALLVDERPEEVTHFRRHVAAEVYASSNDQSLDEHIRLANLVMAHVRIELECGRDTVVLVDSLTRLTRAFNLRGGGSRRTLSGGVDAGALEVPRRIFGLARNIENGGSVTILATTLVGTGSRMDDLIFEEFKGTGNSELLLDRELAEARIFPAIHVLSSSTRKEELLYSDDEMARLTKLRRWLAGGSPKAATRGLLKLIHQTEDNRELLARIQI